jgi:hypothetical protein
VNSNRVGAAGRLTVSGESLLCSAGGALLVETARATGLSDGLSVGLAGFFLPRAVHDPGKVVFDVATALALGGDCLADVSVVRCQPALFGLVGSDPTVSRVIDRLAGGVDEALAGIRGARAAARAAAWAHRSPVAATGLVPVDLDASLVASHSEKERAAPTYKRGYGFHPLLAFVDHTAAGAGGGGEPLAGLLRGGSANANNADDHIAVLDLALAQLPEEVRGRVLVRADSAGGTKRFLDHVTGLRLTYSVGIGVNIGVDRDLLASVPAGAWTAAYDPDGQPRDGAQVAELTGLLPALAGRGWPAGMRIIARRERPHPGAQLRLTDADGWRITVFATNAAGGQLADLEVTHRLRARCEDRIRGLKDTGLTNLPLHEFDQNQIWLETVLLAADLLTWTQTLGLREAHRRAEPRRLRLRLLHVAARIVHTGRRVELRLPGDWPWAQELATAHQHLRALPAPP